MKAPDELKKLSPKRLRAKKKGLKVTSIPFIFNG